MRVAIDPLKERRWLKVILHVLAWTAFILYEQGVVYYTTEKLYNFRQFGSYYLINILLFYGHTWLLGRTLGKPQGRWLTALLLASIEIVIVVALKGAITYTSSQIPFSIETMKRFAVLDLARSLYFAGLATIIWAVSHLSAYRIKMVESELAQLAASRDLANLNTNLAMVENAYLQQQIHPHLLFNTLNFIYNAVYKYSREGAQAVVQLAEIMRYSLEGAGTDGQVALISEIAQVENLIELNRCRYDHPLYLDTQFHGGIEDCRIIPLVLLTLSENIFKHGHLSDPDKPAYLQVSYERHRQLSITTFNYKKHLGGHQRISRLGIDNLRKRLNYAYGDRQDLQIEDAELTYRLQLTINL